MDKKNILITGCSNGVGMALAKHLSGRFNVIALARRIEKMNESFRDYDNIYCYEFDIGDLDHIKTRLNDIKNRHSKILYIINCAGILERGSVFKIPMDTVEHSLKVNAIGPISVINFFVSDMIENNFGRVINLTSGAPLNCFPNFGAYSASKSVLNILTVTLAKELGEKNIKINLMSPGPVRSEMAPDAPMDPSVCFPTVEYLLDIDESGESGKFFWLGYEVPLFPNLDGVKWLEGIGNEKLRKVEAIK